jgi:hypothetical protein
VEHRRIDAAQPHLGVDVEPRPNAHPRLKRVAIYDADDFGQIAVSWVKFLRSWSNGQHRLSGAHRGVGRTMALERGALQGYWQDERNPHYGLESLRFRKIHDLSFYIPKVELGW